MCPFQHFYSNRSSVPVLSNVSARTSLVRASLPRFLRVQMAVARVAPDSGALLRPLRLWPRRRRSACIIYFPPGGLGLEQRGRIFTSSLFFFDEQRKFRIATPVVCFYFISGFLQSPLLQSGSGFLARLDNQGSLTNHLRDIRSSTAFPHKKGGSGSPRGKFLVF